jgi:endonuclease YncB( thermonuclease family)
MRRSCCAAVKLMIRVLLVSAGLASSASAAPIDPARISVVDADTIQVSGEPRLLRLVGFNAPETSGAQCAAERELGQRATQRLREIVSAGKLDLRQIRCACPPGTEGTPSCNHGRSCGILRSHGRDVGRVLISERMAVPFRCKKTRCPPAPRPWCGR